MKRGTRHSPSHRKRHLGDFLLEDVHVYRVNRHSFTIYVGGDPNAEVDDGLGEPGVEYLMADRFETNLDTLSNIDSTRPILIHLSSCGGSWQAGMQMFGAILTCPNPITVLGTKWTRSMTSLIPLAADRFVLRPPTKYMFHRGSYGFSGTGLEAETDAIEYREIHELMCLIYAVRLKEQGRYRSWSLKRILKMVNVAMYDHSDVWLNADETVAWGFADAVFDGDYTSLRTVRVNRERRTRMLRVLRTSIKVELSASYKFDFNGS